MVSREAARELKELTAALGAADVPTPQAAWESPPRIGRLRTTWLTAGLLLIVIVALLWVVRWRSNGVNQPRTAPASLTVSAPNR